MKEIILCVNGALIKWKFSEEKEDNTKINCKQLQLNYPIFKSGNIQYSNMIIYA